MTRDKMKSAIGLKRQLEIYVEAAGAIKATLRQRMGNWPIYAAATGSAMAMATNASADSIIAYVGPPVTVGATGRTYDVGNSVQVGAAYFTLNIYHRLANRGVGTIGRAFAGARYGSTLGSSGFMNVLSSNRLISAHEFASPDTQRVLKSIRFNGNSTVTMGPWAASVPGFEGFRFATLGAPGEFHYGWAELEYGADGNGVPNSLTLLALAYNETAGAPITAGELPAPTPEPGTAGLMLLALGAAGVALLRKRKQIATIPGPTLISNGAR